MDLETNEDEGFVVIANELLRKCGNRGEISQIQECRDAYFVNVYKGLLGDDLKGIISNPLTSEDQAHNCQAVIDALSSEVLNTDLSHITGANIVKRDCISIRNLLEIFAGLLEYFVEITEEGLLGNEEDDSNLLSSDHDVISSILLEEFGPEYKDNYYHGETSQVLDKRDVPRKKQLHQDTLGALRSSQPRPYAPERNWDTRSTTAQEEQRMQEDVESRTSHPSGPVRSWRTGNGKLTSASFSGYAASMDTDFSKVSDSTTELIRLGETSSETSTPTKQIIGSRNKSLPLHPSSISNGGNQKASTQHSLEDHRMNSFRKSERDEILNISKSSKKQATGQQSADDSKESENVDHDLTQYTLQSDEGKGKETSPTASILSSSSSSASWPQQISPLDPKVDGTSTAAGFGSLGVRPQHTDAQPAANSDGSGSGRSSPILHHHYHHHFHHPPQEQVPTDLPLTSGTSKVPVPSKSNVAVSVKPDSTSDISVAINVPCSTAISSSKGSNGNYVISSSVSRNVHETGAVPLSESTTLRRTAPASNLTHLAQTAAVSSFKSSSLGTGFAPESDKLLKTAPPRYAWADSTNQSRNKRHLSGERLHARHLYPSLVTASTTATTLSDSVFSTETKTQTGLDKNFLRSASSLGKDAIAERFQTITKRPPHIPGAKRTEEYGDVGESWRVHGPPTVQRHHYDDLLAKYRGQSRNVISRKTMDEKEKHESDQSEESDGDEVELLSDSAVDYGEKDSIDSSKPDSSSRVTDIAQKPKNVSKSKGETERRPKLKLQHGVRFNEDVETIPITSRVERLRRIMDEAAREDRALNTQSLRSVYKDQLRDLEREQHVLKRKKQADSPKVPKKKPKSKVQPRRRLERIYKPHTRMPRKQKRQPEKGRKRSASASPVLRHRKTSPVRIDEGDELLPTMLEEFPFLHVSPQTAHNMWSKQARQVSALLRSDSEAKRSKTQRMIDEAERRQESLVKILKKELEHNQRMREQQQRMEQERAMKIKLREKRQVSARARKYYDEYQLRMRARMLKKRTKEEQIFKRLFEDGLEIQKNRIRELRQYAKEKREAQAKRQQNEIESLENYYRDQFSMLAENMARERYELECREKAQDKVMKQLKKELRQKMENEIKDFQENLNRDEDSAYFRQLEADRLRREFQLSSNKSLF